MLRLLQIAARTLAGLSARLDTAYAALVDGLTAELAGWIDSWGPQLTELECAVVAALGVNGLLGARFATNLRRTHTPIPDDQYLAEWTTLLAGHVLSTLPPTRSRQVLAAVPGDRLGAEPAPPRPGHTAGQRRGVEPADHDRHLQTDSRPRTSGFI